MSQENLEAMIQKLVHSRDDEESRAIYDQWAEQYDTDLRGYGYVAPRNAVALFTQFVPDQAAQILDAGCGTGQVGSLLKREGYQCIVGSDYSQKMLDQAERTGAYTKLFQADFSQKLAEPDNCYDAIISVGVYNSHFSTPLVEQWLRVLKPGGILLFTCRPVHMDEALQQLLLRYEKHDGHQRVLEQALGYIEGQQANAWYLGIRKSA